MPPPNISYCAEPNSPLPRSGLVLWLLSDQRDKTHSRRKYVEVAESFPEEVRFVLETLREVYKTDAQARREGLDP